MALYVLGPEGTYGHEAAKLYCERSGGDPASLLFLASHADVFAVVQATASTGVVAVENSIEGYVAETVRGFWLRQPGQPGLHVIGELNLPIRHCLLARRPRLALGGPARILSHPQALGQCRDHIGKMQSWGNVVTEPTLSTAEAARLVAMDDAYAEDFAIASRFAAERYGLKVVEENYGDEPRNTTRFHVLGTQVPKPTGCDRTAVIFWLPNQPRRLVRALIAIAGEYGINLSSLHSLPLGEKGMFAFYVEFDEHVHSPRGGAALHDLEKVAERVLWLGSYPQEQN